MSSTTTSEPRPALPRGTQSETPMTGRSSSTKEFNPDFTEGPLPDERGERDERSREEPNLAGSEEGDPFFSPQPGSPGSHLKTRLPSPTSKTSPQASTTTTNSIPTTSSTTSSSYFHNTHTHLQNLPQPQLPALVSLRNALLGYLSEAEELVRLRIGGEGGVGHVGAEGHGEDDQEGQGEGHLDAAKISPVDYEVQGREGISTSFSLPASLSHSHSHAQVQNHPDSTSTSNTGQGLRNRSKSYLPLPLRLPSTMPAMPAMPTMPTMPTLPTLPTLSSPHLPNPEALLLHLSSIREDVLSHLPALPFPWTRLPESSGRVPEGAERVSAGGSRVTPGGAVGALLLGLPGRLGVIQEGLPGLGRFGVAGGEGMVKGHDKANPPPSHSAQIVLPNLSTRLSPSNRHLIKSLIKNILPSEEWSGWERLGWEDVADDEDGDQGLATWLYPGLGRSKSFTSSASVIDRQGRGPGRGGRSGEFQTGRDRDDLSAMAGRRRRSDDEGFKRKVETALEMDEEPEYLFPNKTPRAALRRLKSYAAEREARVLKARRARSFSLGEKAVEWGGGELRRTRSGGEVYEGHQIRETGDGQREELEEEDLPEDYDYEQKRSGSPEEADEEDQTERAEEQIKLDLIEIDALDVGPSLHETLGKSENGKRLVEYDDLPWWMRNNEYVITGYRFIPLDAKTGPLRLIASAFHWHNETINIHSHFIPSVLLALLFIPYTLFNPPFVDPAPLDILTLLAFLASASACLISSASWHTLAGCARRRVFEWGACVDYVGISWLISCSIHTVYYNGFYCQGRTLLVYTCATLASAIAGSIAPFQPFFNERHNKKYRIAFFLAICLTAVAPITHLAFRHGLARSLLFAAPIAPSCLSYIIGLSFYATHFPESKWPGRFDRFGHSHQIWHISILFGIYLHYTGTLTIFESRHSMACSAAGTGAPMSSYLRGWGHWLELAPAGTHHQDGMYTAA